MKAAIVGAGYSEVGRNLERSAGSLTLEACRAALDDAGLTAKDVDAIATYPGGHDSVPVFYVVEGLGIPRLNWWNDLFGWMPAGITPVIAAADAVAAGQCEVALAFRSVKRNRERPPGIGFSNRVGGDAQFRAPFGDVMTSQWLAMWARRHMHEYGTTEAQLGSIAVTFREHAALNPLAPLRDRITLDDYFASRMITTPFHILDCDFPVDGGGAVVITTEERARDLARPPVIVERGVFATGPRPDWDQWEDLTAMASAFASDVLWRRTDLSATDVHVAELYDGFSWTALSWVEDLGFCAKGEGGAFFEAGRGRIGGDLPVNTHGGSLSAGRLHAISHVIECVQQLRGACGDRQVANASIGVVTAGGGQTAGALLLRR